MPRSSVGNTLASGSSSGSRIVIVVVHIDIREHPSASGGVDHERAVYSAMRYCASALRSMPMNLTERPGDCRPASPAGTTQPRPDASHPCARARCWSCPPHRCQPVARHERNAAPRDERAAEQRHGWRWTPSTRALVPPQRWREDVRGRTPAPSTRVISSSRSSGVGGLLAFHRQRAPRSAYGFTSCC